MVNVLNIPTCYPWIIPETPFMKYPEVYWPNNQIFYIKLQQSFLSSCFNSILLSIAPLSPLTADPHGIVPNQPKYNQQQLVQCYLIPSYPLYHVYSTIGTKLLLLSNLHEIAFENMQHKNPPPHHKYNNVNMCGQIYSPGGDTILDPSVPPPACPFPDLDTTLVYLCHPLMSHPETLLPICPEPINCLWYDWTTMMMMTLIYLLSLRMNTKSYFGNNECIEINQMHKHSQFKIGTTRQVNGVYLECNVSSVAEEGALSTKSLFIVANLPFEFL